MRRCICLAVISITARSAIAESIELADGRIFENASITGESATRVTIRHSQGLASVSKTTLPEALQKKYPMREEIAPAIKPMPQAATPRRPPEQPAKKTAVTVEPEEPAAPPSDEHEKARARSQVSPLLRSYFAKRHTPMGGRVEISLRLEEPSKVEGWGGRWRMHGFATLASYRDIDPRRSEDLNRDPNLSSKQVSRIIANETFIQSEIVEFDVDISNLDTTPEIDVTVR